MAFGAELAARVRGQPAALTQVSVDALRGDFAASSAKAQRELGVRFRPVEETLRDAVAWFRSHGYVQTRGGEQPQRVPPSTTGVAEGSSGDGVSL
jgi:dihydroflavonol-4-reductase